MVKKLLISFGFLLAISVGLYAQSGTLKGYVLDKESKEPVPFANVVIQSDGVQKGGASADIDGLYTIKPIEPGVYTVMVSAIGFQARQVNNVRVIADQIVWLDLDLNSTTIGLEAVEIVDYEVPLISKDKTQSGGTVTSEEIEKMPEKSVAAVASTIGGVFSRDGEVGNIRGQRSSGTVYYIDGIKVTGSTSLPQSAYDQISVVLGGLPAQYGDVTGGVISVTTKGPSRVFGMGIEYQTSGFGENRGLDAYGYNRIGVNLNGPLIKSKNANDETAILGYFLAGDFVYQFDNSPKMNGVYVATDEYLDYLKENPIRLSNAGTGVWNNANFITEDDLVLRKSTPNTPSLGVSLSGKIDVKTSPYVNLSFGGNYNYSNGRSYSYSNSMFNSETNTQGISQTWRVYGRLSQRFKTNEESLLQNVYYELNANYTNYSTKSQDATHKDNLFNYGYIGKYETNRYRNYTNGSIITEGEDGETIVLSDVNIFTGYVDSMVSYTPGNLNPYLANYMSQFYSFFPDAEGYYDNINSIWAANGLMNGDSPVSIYSLFNAVGTNQSGYYKSETQQIGFSFKASADIGNHAINFGFQFEQRFSSYFSSATTSLWNYLRNFTNSHISELDLDNPVLQYDGDVFLGTVDYNYLYSESSQYKVDKSLRQLMGLPVDGTDWIDVDSYDPEQNTINYYDAAGNYLTATLNGNLSLDMFSVDELLDNELVSYRGYDAYGNKIKGSYSVEDFLTNKDETTGYFLRNIGASRPIYGALYIQDVFSFRDLIFNIGVRVDRYDANQQVLSDAYLLYPAYTAGDVRNAVDANMSQAILDEIIPSNIGDDYVVYVDDVNDPKTILGYRNGNTWYDANGTYTTDPETALDNGSGVSPFLIDAAATNTISAKSFTDYKPQINVMPRISFSFPISDEALFFAHYDILTQRPTSYATLSVTDYYYLPSKTSSTISNPNLKPETTIDYEIGFQQKLTNSSSLILSAFYREYRDQIQIYRFTAAYPKTYYSFENIDFGTAKGLTITYDLRRTKNIRLKAAYTLQFANGTGSDPEATRAIVTSGQPNLRTLTPLDYDQRHKVNLSFDYRFDEGKKYNGPVTTRTTKSGETKTINWLQNTGLNVTFMGGTGTPYTRSSRVYPLTNTQRVIDGSINGSRMPAFFKCDLRLDRDFLLNANTKKQNAVPHYLNVYIQVLNVFNSANVNYVYPATGNANDDGYLSDPEYASQVSQQLNEASYRLLYSIRCDDPGHYSGPRVIRLGVSYNF